MHFSTTGKVLLGLMGLAFFQGLTGVHRKEEVEDLEEEEDAPPPPPSRRKLSRLDEIYREYYLKAKRR